MPLIRRFSNLSVYIYAAPNEHPPPHFHIVGPNIDVSVEIGTLRIMVGQYRARDIAEVLAWAGANRDELMKAWETYNERG